MFGRQRQGRLRLSKLSPTAGFYLQNDSSEDEDEDKMSGLSWALNASLIDKEDPDMADVPLSGRYSSLPINSPHEMQSPLLSSAKKMFTFKQPSSLRKTSEQAGAALAGRWREFRKRKGRIRSLFDEAMKKEPLQRHPNRGPDNSLLYESLDASSLNASEGSDFDCDEYSPEDRLEILTTIVDQTKLASELLFEDHQELLLESRTAAENHTLTEMKLEENEKALKSTEHLLASFKKQVQDLENQNKNIENEKSQTAKELEKWKLMCNASNVLADEREAVIQRNDRQIREHQATIERVQKESAEASAVSAKLKGELDLMKETHEQMRLEMLGLKQRSSEKQEELERLLMEAHTEKTVLQTQLEEAQDDASKARSEHMLSIKTIEELRSQVGLLEESVKDFTAKADEDKENEKRLSFSRVGKDNSTSPIFPMSACSICFKGAVGAMRKCQCGNNSCKCLAHAHCVNKIKAGSSVSHPCTPAMPLPVILCGSSIVSKARLSLRNRIQI